MPSETYRTIFGSCLASHEKNISCVLLFHHPFPAAGLKGQRRGGGQSPTNCRVTDPLPPKGSHPKASLSPYCCPRRCRSQHKVLGVGGGPVGGLAVQALELLEEHPRKPVHGSICREESSSSREREERRRLQEGQRRNREIRQFASWVGYGSILPLAHRLISRPQMPIPTKTSSSCRASRRNRPKTYREYAAECEKAHEYCALPHTRVQQRGMTRRSWTHGTTDDAGIWLPMKCSSTHRRSLRCVPPRAD